MRKVDENRAQNYIKKHRGDRRWMAFALCVSIFTGTVTLYLLNKPATAMTEDGAKQVGLVLETADDDFEMGLIEQMNAEEAAALEDTGVTETSDEIVTLDVSELGDPDDSSKTWEEIIEVIPEDETEADASDSASSKDASDASSLMSSDEESADASTSASSEEVKKIKKQSFEDVEDVVLTAKFVDANGKEISPSKEYTVEAEDGKADLLTDYPVIENYYYVDASIDDTKIVSLEKKTAQAELAADEGDDSTDSAAAFSVSSDEEDETTAESVTYTYYLAKTVDGQEIEIEENKDLVFAYVAANTKEAFTYKDDEVTVTVKLSKPGILPEGVELSVKTIDKETEGYNYEAYLDALNDNADKIAQANGEEEAVEYNDDNTVLFDIAFMLENIEYEPKDGTVSVSIYFNNRQISEGLGTDESDEISVVHLPVAEEIMQDLDTTSDATEITSSDITVEVLTESTVNLGTNTDLITFETESFSVYGAIKPSKDGNSWTGSNYYSAREIVGWLGDITYFGVVAGTYNGGGSHSEANIAVQNIENIQYYTIGISTKVYTSIDEYKITVNKKISSGLKTGTFNFALYSDAKGKEKIPGTEFSITTDSNGEGSHTKDYAYLLKSGNYPRLYVFELDDEGNAVMEGGIIGSYVVSYDGNAVNAPSDTIGFYADNYVESVGLNGYSAENVLEKVDGATIYYPTGWNSYMGITYYQNQVYGTKPNGTQGWTNYVRHDYEGQMPVSVSNMRDKAREASKKLVYAVNGNDIEVVNIVATKENGDLQTDLSTKYFKDKNDPYNYAVNTGFKVSEDKLIVINVDMTGTKNYNLQKFTYNGEGTGDWSQAANHVLINLVQKNKNGEYVPYTGTVNSNIMSGTLVAPDANINVYGSYSGTIVANYVYKQCEIHKMDMRRYLDDAYSLTVTNTGTHNYPFEITAYKYVDDQVPNQNEVFSFTLRFYDAASGKWKVIDENLHNDGDTIKYTVSDPTAEPFGMKYDNGSKSEYFFLLTENDTSEDYTKDKTAILVKVKYYPKKDDSGKVTKDIAEINYYRIPEKGVNNLISKFDNSYNSDTYRIKPEKESKEGKLLAKVAFFNTTKTTQLRIHKIVVNDFGSDFVRSNDNTGSGLLSKVKFRITNNETGNYIVFTGFTGAAKTTGTATEYDKNSHKPTGKYFTVTYNQSAQWTVEGLPAGTYTVDEVADGLTFTYDPSDNYSVIVDNKYHLSRVTQYDLTVDDDEKGLSWKYGTGGENYRKVFAVDLHSKREQPPTNVRVGGGVVQTVQICNYYSIPVAPVQVTKNFSGGKWPEGVSFSFDIEKIGFTAYDSEGNELKLSADDQPMPEKTQISVSAADASYDETPGLYTAIADFGAFPFRFEGTYYYKVTENTTNKIDGIKYDSSTYYFKVVVSKKYTQFKKTYSYEKMTHPAGYTQDTTLLEDFWYLGADVTYATDEKFSNIVAQCQLYLGIGPDTSLQYMNDFGRYWTIGSLDNVAFNNSLVGDLTVSKVWQDQAGNENSANHTSLTLYIWQRTVGSTEWKLYEGTTIQLSSTNNWTQTVTGLPLTDENGKAIEYCVKEPDEYLSTYQVTYSYNGTVINANNQQKIKVGSESTKDTGYAMHLQTTNSFGTVQITNRAFNFNELPSTGGIGTRPLTMAGMSLILFAFIGFILFGKRKRPVTKV